MSVSAHLLHWLEKEKTLSPVERQLAMQVVTDASLDYMLGHGGSLISMAETSQTLSECKKHLGHFLILLFQLVKTNGDLDDIHCVYRIAKILTNQLNTAVIDHAGKDEVSCTVCGMYLEGCLCE